jgi:hypothetical protein
MLRKCHISIMLATIYALLPLVARGQDDRREQISAATARAVEGLRMQIAAEPIGRNLTVGDLLKATNGAATLGKTLARAQMIGGPRWIDEQTCQVQLEISGPRARGALVQIATTHEKKSPIAANVLEMRLREWDSRTFSATGTSTGATAIENVRPVEDGVAWQRVSDESRQQAIAAARRQAAASVIDQIKPIKLDETTVGQVLTDPHVRSAIEEWVASRPVTQVEFRDDLQVRVTVATPADELFAAFRAAGEKSDALAKLDESVWSRLRNDFAASVSPTSRGSARAGAAVNPAAAPALEIATPPPWVNEQHSADGASAAHKSPLKCARAAEADAQARLRTQIEKLPLSNGRSVGELAAQEPRFAEAVDRAIARARPTKVDYQSDGSARVRVTLDLQTVWEEIAAAR